MTRQDLNNLKNTNRVSEVTKDFIARNNMDISKISTTAYNTDVGVACKVVIGNDDTDITIYEVCCIKYCDPYELKCVEWNIAMIYTEEFMKDKKINVKARG